MSASSIKRPGSSPSPPVPPVPPLPPPPSLPTPPVVLVLLALPTAFTAADSRFAGSADSKSTRGRGSGLPFDPPSDPHATCSSESRAVAHRETYLGLRLDIRGLLPNQCARSGPVLRVCHFRETGEN